jgi:hypothetical protein
MHFLSNRANSKCPFVEGHQLGFTGAVTDRERLLRSTGYSQEEMAGMNHRAIVDGHNYKSVFSVLAAML